MFEIFPLLIPAGKDRPENGRPIVDGYGLKAYDGFKGWKSLATEVRFVKKELIMLENYRSHVYYGSVNNDKCRMSAGHMRAIGYPSINPDDPLNVDDVPNGFEPDWWKDSPRGHLKSASIQYRCCDKEKGVANKMHSDFEIGSDLDRFDTGNEIN